MLVAVCSEDVLFRQLDTSVPHRRSHDRRNQTQGHHAGRIGRQQEA
jgi:hypothetical protein